MRNEAKRRKKRNSLVLGLTTLCYKLGFLQSRVRGECLYRVFFSPALLRYHWHKTYVNLRGTMWLFDTHILQNDYYNKVS